MAPSTQQTPAIVAVGSGRDMRTTTMARRDYNGGRWRAVQGKAAEGVRGLYERDELLITEMGGGRGGGSKEPEGEVEDVSSDVRENQVCLVCWFVTHPRAR